MSSIEATKLKGVSDSVKRVLGVDPEQRSHDRGVIESIVPSLRDADIETAKAQRDQRRVSGSLAQKSNALSIALKGIKGLQAIPIRNGFSLTMNEQLLFSTGSADVSGKGRDVLKTVGEMLRKTDALIRVEGNTDDLSISNKQYPSNWELSLARAANVTKYLILNAGIAPERLCAAGYADTRPIVANDSMQNRQLNRRLDIILTFPED
jgi:chemotaxis protein MotB